MLERIIMSVVNTKTILFKDKSINAAIAKYLSKHDVVYLTQGTEGRREY